MNYTQLVKKLWVKRNKSINAEKKLQESEISSNNLNDFAEKPEIHFPLEPDLPLPQDVTEKDLFNFLQSVLVDDAPPEEIKNYCSQDFKRFVYTYGLLKNFSGRCLELGANPYFTTMLLKQFTSVDLSLANYFGPHQPQEITQVINYKDFYSGEYTSCQLKSQHFNIEEELFPYKDDEFNIVLFCEIIEHLLVDPAAVLREIKRVLKPQGVLILTTPNVSRLENVTKMIAGVNIYDPYSGYGPYGRHNREYNKHELYLLLEYLGFSIDVMFTADVHQNHADLFSSVAQVAPLLTNRSPDLGQYIFVRAINSRPARDKKPSFLYRSYSNEELE